MICYFWSKMTIIYYINEASLIQWVTKEESLKLTDKSFYEVCISTSFILSNKLFLFVSRSKKIAILLCYLLQRMSWICYYGKKTKVFKIIFYSSTTLVSVPWKVSWLWRTCNWVFYCRFTYWVGWGVRDPFSVLEIKCNFSVLTFIALRVEHLGQGRTRASEIFEKYRWKWSHTKNISAHGSLWVS